MSVGFYNEEEQLPNFGPTIAVSIFLHIAFIVLIVFTANNRPIINVKTPIYTVDLLAPVKTAVPPAVRTSGETLKKENSQAEVVSKPVKQAQDKDISRHVVKEKAIALKKEKEHSFDEAIEKIQKRVEKREVEEAVNKTIEELQNKQLEKKIKEIKERVVHRQVIVKPVKEKTEGANKIQQNEIVKRAEMAEGKYGADSHTGATQQGSTVRRIEEVEEKYGNILWEKISPQWNYTGDIKEGEFVIITVRVDKTGHLVKSYVEQSSANPILIQSAIRAIEKAAPFFPSFPPELEKDSLEIGVCFPECKN